jgi:hypothetical protein
MFPLNETIETNSAKQQHQQTNKANQSNQMDPKPVKTRMDTSKIQPNQPSLINEILIFTLK